MRLAVTILALLLTTGCAKLRPGGAPAPEPTRAATPASDGIKPYSELITEEAKSEYGLFTTHRIGDKLYYEIPNEALDTEMLLVTTIAKNGYGDFGGVQVANRVLRWERHDKRILLRTPTYHVMADSTQPIYQAVESANYAPILASFDIEAFGPDSAAVIEVSKLYTGNLREFGLGLDNTRLEQDRSYLERIAAYPENIEVEATHTYTVTPRPLPFGYQPPPHTESLLLRWSMVRLPEEPMLPRRLDARVGYFSVRKIDYGTDEHRAAEYSYITRWRLECKPGEASPCEPIKPIVFYIDPATPAEWVPYVKAGIEDWQGAFEGAGFKNAIIAKEAPSPEEDPTWSMEDARYSIVRWMPSTTENAMGPHVHDPRTGEILQSDIHMYHNVMNLLRSWYFTQVAPLDKRAQRLPLPNPLMGRLLQYVVAHEVGHTLGLQHNMKASSQYPADSLRNESFLRRMRHVSSIMDYARFNYVAQPEDNIPPELLVPDIGPYDEFAIMWGYKPIPGASSPEDELETLHQWALVQDTKPWLRFSTQDAMDADAGQLTEAIGDADAVYSTGMGLRNIKRTVPMLIEATIREGEDLSDLGELYGRLVSQWTNIMSHVVTIVGGIESQEKYGGQDGVRFELRPAAEQRKAVAFLNEHAFTTPDYLLDTEILRRVEVFGALKRIEAAQNHILDYLISNNRLHRMIEFQALAARGETVYTVEELLRDLRGGIWSELGSPSVKIDAVRRALQNRYLGHADSKLNPEPKAYDPPHPDMQALLRLELAQLNAEIRRALPRAADTLTRAHLEAARIRINRILDPNGAE